MDTRLLLFPTAIILLIGFAMSAFAQDQNCSITVPIAQLYAAVEGLEGQPTNEAFHSASETLLFQARSIDLNKAQQRLSTDFGATTVENLIAFTRLAQEIGGFAISGETTRALNLMRSPNSLALRTATRDALVTSGCEEARHLSQSALQANLNRRSAPENKGLATLISFGNAALLGLAATSTIGAIYSFRSTQRRRARRKMRQQARFPISFKTELVQDGATASVHLVDINCYGVKVRPQNTSVLKTGVKGSLTLGDQRIAFTVTWANQKYFGAVFDQALSEEFVQQLIQTAKYQPNQLF